MFPPRLIPFYEQIIAKVSSSNNAEVYKRILSIVAVAKRLFILVELVSLDDTLHKLNYPEDISRDLEDLEQIIN
jgi:hypothetical protein